MTIVFFDHANAGAADLGHRQGGQSAFNQIRNRAVPEAIRRGVLRQTSFEHGGFDGVLPRILLHRFAVIPRKDERPGQLASALIGKERRGMVR